MSRHEAALCHLFSLVIEFTCRFSDFLLRCEAVLCYLFFLVMEFANGFSDSDLTQNVKTLRHNCIVSPATWLYRINVHIYCFDPLFYCLIPVMNNPANFAKHQANPKVGPIIAKMMGKFSGSQ